MNKADLLAKTKIELLKVAQRHGLRGVSTLKKEELAEKIHLAQQRSKGAVVKQPLDADSVSRKMADAIKRRAVRKHAAETSRSHEKSLLSSEASRARPWPVQQSCPEIQTHGDEAEEMRLHPIELSAA